MPRPRKGPRLGSGPDHEKLLLGTLAAQLFTHGRIRTTEARAKAVRPLAETRTMNKPITPDMLIDRGEGPNLGGITKGIDVWKPIIAAINGYCLAGGMELAMACDIRIAADHAKFGVVNRRWNVGAESGLTQRLPHIVGLGVALDLLLTGRWFDAKEAYRINFVSRVVGRRKLLDECTALAEGICAYPQSSLRTDKEACLRGLGRTLEDGLRLENTLWNTNLALPDTLNGPRAFIERRTFVPTQET